MKKTISILLSIAVVLAAFLAVPSVSAEEAHDNEPEEMVIDYDAGPYVGSEFRQIYRNGSALNNYEGGEAPRTALAAILTNDGYVDDRSGSGQTLGLEGWVGFDQAITAFGAMINDEIEWDESFDKGSSAEIKSEDKGGRYAKFYSVNIDISKARNRYTAGVAVALADGTVVKLNSTDYPEANTFINFLGPEEEMTPGPGTGDVDKTPGIPSPTEVPETTAVPPTQATTAAPTQIPATEVPATEIPATKAPTGAPGESSGGPDKGLIIGLAGAGVTAIIAAVIVAIASKKKKK